MPDSEREGPTESYAGQLMTRRGFLRYCAAAFVLGVVGGIDHGTYRNDQTVDAGDQEALPRIPHIQERGSPFDTRDFVSVIDKFLHEADDSTEKDELSEQILVSLKGRIVSPDSAMVHNKYGSSDAAQRMIALKDSKGAVSLVAAVYTGARSLPTTRKEIPISNAGPYPNIIICVVDRRDNSIIKVNFGNRFMQYWVDYVSDQVVEDWYRGSALDEATRFTMAPQQVTDSDKERIIEMLNGGEFDNSLLQRTFLNVDALWNRTGKSESQFPQYYNHGEDEQQPG